MTLSMQPSHVPSLPFTIAGYNDSPFPPPAHPTAFSAFPQQPPPSRRLSRKRGHVDVDDVSVGDSNGALLNKRQEIHRDVHNTPQPPLHDSPPTLPPPPSVPASMQPSSPLPARCVSPAGSDMSMSDADDNDITDEQLPVDEPLTASSSEAVPSSEVAVSSDEHSSDFYRSTALIRPVLPLPSLSSSAIVELYKHQQRQQQQADEQEHDPSKQLVLYQPAQPLVQLAAVGGGSRAAALRRAHANLVKNGASGLYEWGDISDNAMQT